MAYFETDFGIDELQLKINRYEDMLFGIAYLRLGNRQDAEDVVQETFYRYFRRMKNGNAFADEEHEKAWLIKVSINACRKLRRSAWVRHRAGQAPEELEGRTAETQMGDRSEELKTPSELPEEQVLRRERGEELLKAVMSLPEKYKDVIHLFYYDDLSVREIGALLGRKEATVTAQLTRGRELLRKALREEYDFA